MKVTMDSKPANDFLKNQLNSVRNTKLPTEYLSIRIRDNNAIKVQTAQNLKLVNTNKGFAVVPTNKKLSNGMTAIQAYKMFEYGTSEFSKDPMSPSLRNHVQRVIIPNIIKKMGNKIG